MINQLISHYRIIKKLGEGGMGEVYLAQDTQLDRTVALKVLPASVAHNRGRMHRFLQEARAAAALHHPHLAHIYEIGEAEGTNFIVLEHVEGQTLQARINGRPLAVDELVEIGMETADALAEAHAKGVIHRDIKPSNIMVTPRRGVKILDFGLAKITPPNPESAASDLPTLNKTTPGSVLGTVAYMSPEQALGREVDHRTDIFSLGVVIYEMATGRRPFTGTTPTDTIDLIAHAQPEAIARFNYNITAELERIIRKCLEKDRERRYQSGHELVVDLKNLKRDSDPATGAVKPVAPRQQSVQTRFLLVGLALVLLAAIGVGVFLGRSKTAIDSVAVLPLVNVDGDPETEYLSDGMTENLISRLSQLPNLRVIARSSAFRYKGRDVDAQTAGRELGVSAVLVGRVIKRGDSLSISVELVDIRDNSQLWGDQYNRQFSDILTVQKEISQEVSERLRLRLTSQERQQLSKNYTDKTEAYQLYLKGRYFWNKRTEEGMKKGIEYFRQAIEVDAGYSLAYTGLADSYNFLGAFGIAVLPPGDAMPKAKSAAVRALEIDDSLAEAHASLAFVKLYYDWDWPGAEREFQRAIELNPNYAPAHQWYSHLLMARGRSREAISEAKRAMEIDPLSLPANMNVGWQYHWARQYDLAVDHLRKSLEMDPNFEQGHWGLGLAYERKGMFEEAAAEFQKAMALSGGNPVYVAAFGHTYAVGGKRADARSVRDELVEQLNLRYIPPYWVATLYVGLGEQEQALRWLEKAYAERSGGLIWLGVDPRMDSLRSEPRFAALMQRLGLSQIASSAKRGAANPNGSRLDLAIASSQR